MNGRNKDSSQNEDIENVASYLAKTYYKIPCPDC